MRPDCTVLEPQVTATEVTDELIFADPPLFPPPPQAARQTVTQTTTARFSWRTRGPLLDFVWIDARGKKRRNVGAAADCPHVSGLLNDEAGQIQQERPLRGEWPRRDVLAEFLEISAEERLQVEAPRTAPPNGEDRTPG